MPNTPAKPSPAHFIKRTLHALLAAAVCFVVCFFVWMSAVRPASTKSQSDYINDDYTAVTAVQRSLSQTFAYDKDLLAVALVFGLPNGQPQGTLELTLTDADTGELLAASTGDLGSILPGQYTGLGLDHPVEGREGRRYKLTITPHYTTESRVTIGHSTGNALWDGVLTVDGDEVDGTASLLVTHRQIGGFLSRFYWVIAAGLIAVVALAVWLAQAKKLRLAPATAVLVVLFGLLYSAVLPPYAAPDEQYHINQSFTLACRWANVFSAEDWHMGHVPLSTSYRRPNDANPLIQDEKTTVFTWQEAAENFFTTTDDAFDSHTAREEAQTDGNPTMYLASAAAVFTGYLFHLGFVPTLFLGRLANLLLFAALAALAVHAAPFGKRILFAVALLPMSLHLAASFSRDGPILGLCLLFVGLCLKAAYGAFKKERLGPAILLPLAAVGLLLAPAKLVYLPLTALVFVIPAARLGGKKTALLQKTLYLAACALLAVAVNSSVLSTAATTPVQTATAAEPAAQQTAASTAPLPQPTPAASAAPEGLAADDAPEITVTPGATAQPTLVPALAAQLSAPTTEGFVRRLYYYGADRLDETGTELQFWVQALQDGDVSTALLGQSFFFGPDADFTEEALVTAASQAFLNRDILQTDSSLLTLARRDGKVAAYKAIFSSEEADNLLAPGVQRGSFDETRVPLDREELKAAVQTAQDARAKQSVATGADAICFTPQYILTHLPSTAMLVANSLVQNGDHYLRTLVGGSLSYYTLDLAWGWVVLLYLLLFYAALRTHRPAENKRPAIPRPALVLGTLAALACCGLVILGCITWTPTYYQTIYGLQGRYFLPALPLLLLLFSPKNIRVQPGAERPLLVGLGLANAGVLLNAMLAVIAR